jgi:hypothetical protein
VRQEPPEIWALVRLPVTVAVPVIELETKFTLPKEVKFAVMLLLFERVMLPPAAAEVPPPTKDAVIEAFVIRATSTVWSTVTVKLLE